MRLRNLIGRIALPLVRGLPHRRLTLPYPKDSRLSLSFYPDTELGLWLGFNEPSVIQWWKREVREGMVVYDVGAHIGVYSLLPGVRGAQTHAFEPARETFDWLRGQVERNGLDDDIKANEFIESDRSGEMTLYRDPDGRRHSLLDSEASTTSEKVASTTIDQYSQRHPPPDIVKVDVEGAAHRVIAGAGAVLSAGDATWLIELHNEDERRAVKRAIRRCDLREEMD